MKIKKYLFEIGVTLIFATSVFGWDKGILPPITPLFDYPMRDVCIGIGGDSAYYMVGTTGAPTWWTSNDGIYLWKSDDLKKWDPQGRIWSLATDATWAKGKGAVWAPEIHYINNTYWMTYTMSNPEGTGLLKSTTGLPTGPYVDVKTDGPMTPQIDASLFQDDDGKVYYLFQDGKIALMNSTMTALAETPHLLSPKNNANVGFEGAYIAKINGRYYLMGAAFNTDTGISTYDCMAASSDKLLGPYGDRYLAFRHAGHNMVFKDKKNQWWSTMFGNDNGAPIRERPGLFRVEVDAFGQLQPYYQPTLSQGKTVTTDANNPAFAPSNGNDGHTASRWAGANGNAGHWWTVDLGKDYRLTNAIVMWEKLGIVYKYKIETSRNNSQWKTVVDRTNNTLITQTQGSDFIDTARYVRITVTGLATNVLPSFYEFQVLGDSSSSTVSLIQKKAGVTGSMVLSQGKMQQMGEPIRFKLSEAGSVTLEAYSLDGNRITPSKALHSLKMPLNRLGVEPS